MKAPNAGSRWGLPHDGQSNTATEARICTSSFISANDDYTTGRPYIQPGRFRLQTLSYEKLTRSCGTRSTTKKTYPPSPQPIQVASQGQPFVYQGMQIQRATRLMREVCALRHLSINTENIEGQQGTGGALPQVPDGAHRAANGVGHYDLSDSRAAR